MNAGEWDSTLAINARPAEIRCTAAHWAASVDGRPELPADASGGLRCGTP